MHPLLKISIWTVLAALVNLLLFQLFLFIDFPLFMDSISTAVIAALFGPLSGVLTALLTHLGLEIWSGFSWLYAPWVLCSISTALLIGGAARPGLFDTIPQLVIVVLLVSLANAFCGALLHTVLYDGIAEHSTDMVVQGFQLLTGKLFWAAFWARVPINVVDKGLAVILAYLAAKGFRTDRYASRMAPRD